MPAPHIPAPLLDRLVDLAPETETETPVFRRMPLSAYLAVLARDVEALLNTRAPYGPPKDGCRPTSPDYGLPDWSDGALSGADAEALARSVRDALEAFEPRLEHIKVKTAPPEENRVVLYVEAGLRGVQGEAGLRLTLDGNVLHAAVLHSAEEFRGRR